MPETVVVAERFIGGDEDRYHMEFYAVYDSVDTAKAAIIAAWPDERLEWLDHQLLGHELLWDEHEEPIRAFAATSYPGQVGPATQTCYTLTRCQVRTPEASR